MAAIAGCELCSRCKWPSNTIMQRPQIQRPRAEGELVEMHRVLLRRRGEIRERYAKVAEQLIGLAPAETNSFACSKAGADSWDKVQSLTKNRQDPRGSCLITMQLNE